MDNFQICFSNKIIHEFLSRSIEFIVSFFQAVLDIDAFAENLLRMRVGGKRGEEFLKIKTLLYDIKSTKEIVWTFFNRYYIKALPSITG